MTGFPAHGGGLGPDRYPSTTNRTGARAAAGGRRKPSLPGVGDPSTLGR
ncbi:hypothetical protein [Streptomyces sp. NPDC002521]